ncbi:hypothetical protein EVAR_23031_1 [Eumeta japonica]|uniref:Uncharacterized protein n=1 Tax=Eumeta variegata TaxID=151549 RepID=A0A4C1URG3_EUMVA|nr:hypothetical protein EVAR_23031_1 [Eumeta japonica]
MYIFYKLILEARLSGTVSTSQTSIYSKVCTHESVANTGQCAKPGLLPVCIIRCSLSYSNESCGASSRSGVATSALSAGRYGVVPHRRAIITESRA